MQKKLKVVQIVNACVICITFLLFAFALFTKGLTHDILLETGVLLVSVKLILSSYTLLATLLRIEKKVDQHIKETK